MRIYRPSHSRGLWRCPIILGGLLAVLMAGAGAAAAPSTDFGWPPITQEARPWAYWHWLGNAQTERDISKLLKQYRAAGLGGLHIIPIYGVKGWESQFRDFLSPEWMSLLSRAVAEGRKRDLGVDMSTGTGWPFGGPNVGPEDAAVKIDARQEVLTSGSRPALDAAAGRVAALVAYPAAGDSVDLTEDAQDGNVQWTAPSDGCRVVALYQTGTAQQVKRSAPGGQGNVLDPFSTSALDHYLQRFDEAFAKSTGPKPRAQYHDSFEYYKANWTPDLLEAFRARRGYKLQDHLTDWLAEPATDAATRISTDYRETIAELHTDFIREWTNWAHGLGFKTRNQAHGAPANILDVYAAADIPETEIFGSSAFEIPGLRIDPDFKGDRPSPLMIKFASSAAHVAGKPLVSSESCTWLAEHFRVSLAQIKPEIDQLLVSGINHVFYHGMPYSPVKAPWPGWLFYASTDFSPAAGLWHDLPALNAYIARSQAILQSGAPSADVLLYFPVHDIWQEAAPGPTLCALAVHNISKWMPVAGFGPIAETLHQRGYAFDYVSDRLLAPATADAAGIHTTGGTYRTVVLPPCRFLPLDTLTKLIELARSGATIVAMEDLPRSVPGFFEADRRQHDYDTLLASLQFEDRAPVPFREARLGAGRILIAKDLEGALTVAGVPREAVTDYGVQFIRRTHERGYHYFFANLGKQTLDGWVRLGVPAQSAVLLDPRLENKAGQAATRVIPDGATECYLQLAPGESCILRTFTERRAEGPHWPYLHVEDASSANELTGPWKVTFLEGGPERPKPFTTGQLGSWTLRGGAAESFLGTARYQTTFELPNGPASDWVLDLGNVGESARVFVNGHSAGALFSLPFRVAIGGLAHPGRNTLAVEVTNLAANRIRDLDRRGVLWRIFLDANVVNINYKPFDASQWPLMDSGLLGPVRLLRGQPAAF